MSSATCKVKACDLKPGMHLCYRASELRSAAMSAVFIRNEKLCGEVVAVLRLDGLVVTLGLGRSLILNPDEMREVELQEPSPMVAHRGVAATFQGISIE